MRVEVIGARELSRTLHAAAQDLAELRATNMSIAHDIRAAAQPPRRTGRLAGSLRAEGSATEAVVSSDLIYAPVIEHGWARHGIEPTRFLARALEGQQSAAVDRVADHVDDCLAQVHGA